MARATEAAEVVDACELMAAKASALDFTSWSVSASRSAQPPQSTPCLSPVPRRLSPRAVFLARVVLRTWAGWAARSAIIGRKRSRTDPTTGRFTRPGG